MLVESKYRREKFGVMLKSRGKMGVCQIHGSDRLANKEKHSEMLSKLRLYVRDILLLLSFVRVNVNLVLVNCFICFLMESRTTSTI